MHVRDEESPARVPFLDRLGGPFSSTFRPQEALSAQVLDAAVRSVNAARPDAVLVTGDLVDNAQANELALARTVLDGGRARPDSGAPGYDGVQDAADPDPAYYRPDVDPPRHPGLLAAAQRPFHAPGLRAPWYAVPGNHDLLVAGELARTPSTAAVAVGGERLVQPDAGLDVPRSENALTPSSSTTLLSGGLPGRTARTAPDPGRARADPGGGDRRPARRQPARRQRRADGLRVRRGPSGARDRARHRAPRRRLGWSAGARADPMAAAASSPPPASAGSSWSPTSR